MITNGKRLVGLRPIKNMLTSKVRENGVSKGLTEAGYDISIAESVFFFSILLGLIKGVVLFRKGKFPIIRLGTTFTLASAIEEFNMPHSHLAEVKDKSTWARRALSVQNTVIEPGWRGFLTLELNFQDKGFLYIKRGSGIAQVLFKQLDSPGFYNGKYQDQEQGPISAKYER